VSTIFVSPLKLTDLTNSAYIPSTDFKQFAGAAVASGSSSSIAATLSTATAATKAASAATLAAEEYCTA
jgi:hypothetical protein